MPTIKIPENVKLTNPDGSQVLDPNSQPVELDFVKSFILNTVTNDQKFGKNTNYLYAAMDLVSAFENKKAGDTVLLSQDLYEKLKEVVRDPSVSYNVVVLKQCRSFFDAVLEPSSDKN